MRYGLIWQFNISNKQTKKAHTANHTHPTPESDAQLCAGCYYSLVCISIWGGGEIDLHDHLELRLVTAVFEGSVVVMATEHIGFVVREAWAVKAEVVAPLVVGVGFTHPVMSWEGCSSERKYSV